MADLAANKEGKIFKVWRWIDKSSPDNDEELLFLVKNKGLQFDPDCSWRAIAIVSDENNISGDQNAILLYTIDRKNGQIVDANLKIVSEEEFKQNYYYC